ncbi:thiolase C-terminal domain-containing protein [Mycolicibacterium vinylchloridicum]|uniref:thiolase C-terminal domain-containing protein n=1 Tax=Mycolicibacterium vinylchloridicum TaxID=2736928 RepID=UPI0015C9B07D|nr:thiolase [Mycolicibacterium vinylchloridicum]
MGIRGVAAIVGASETTRLGKIPDMSVLGLHLDAARNAVADCGIDPKEIDGVATTGSVNITPVSPVVISHYLGLTPKWIDSTSVGGGSFMMLVRHAAAAIATGMCQVALITHGESGRSGVGVPGMPPDRTSPWAQFERPYGPWGAPSLFPIGVLRFMKETGLTHEQLASVPVAQRKWAAMNPRALAREPITVEDVLASPLVAYPMHKMECCLVADGGGAVIITSAERARDMDLSHPPVYLLGAGESAETPMISQMQDMTTSRAFQVSGAAAFAESGVTQADVDHVMIYDAFAHNPIYGLEDLGFVGRGEAGEFIAAGNTAPGGSLPTNTNGGGLCYAHTGMYGMFAIQESVRQLRGTAPAQVDGVRISVAHGVAAYFAASGTLVLGNEIP